jgi:hypothetical protein
VNGDSVTEYHFSTFAANPTCEDTSNVVHPLPEEVRKLGANGMLFGVFDGHSGTGVRNMLSVP